MSQYAADVYTTVEKITATGRQLEASALFRAARSLQLAQDGWGKAGFEAKLDAALKLNQRIWTFFQAELSAADNPLPLSHCFRIGPIARIVAIHTRYAKRARDRSERPYPSFSNL